MARPGDWLVLDHHDLQLSDADTAGRSVEQLASSGVLRRIAIVDDQGLA